MRFKRPRRDYLFLGAQFLLLIFYVFPLRIVNLILPIWISHVGLILLIIGIGFGLAAMFQLKNNLSPFPSPKASSRLITHGVFRISRHPIYLGLLLVCFGYALYVQSDYKVVISIILFVVLY